MIKRVKIAEKSGRTFLVKVQAVDISIFNDVTSGKLSNVENFKAESFGTDTLKEHPSNLVESQRSTPTDRSEVLARRFFRSAYNVSDDRNQLETGIKTFEIT